jgi:hypothetical protein
MAIRNNTVSIKVSRKFFENVFEPGRRNSEINLGVTFSQPKYTEFLAQRNFKLPSAQPIKQKKLFSKRFTL